MEAISVSIMKELIQRVNPEGESVISLEDSMQMLHLLLKETRALGASLPLTKNNILSIHNFLKDHEGHLKKMY